MKRSTGKRSIGSALQSTLQDETAAFQSRLAKADAALTNTSSDVPPTKTAARSATGSKKQAPPVRVIRDSFTMPESDYARIAAVRERALKNGVAVTKAEVLRAGLLAISQLKDDHLTELIGTLDKVKVGRPNTM